MKGQDMKFDIYEDSDTSVASRDYYTYNELNQLTSVRSIGDSRNYRYAYLPNGLRYYKTNGTNYDYMYYDGDQVCARAANAKNVFTHYYAFGLGRIKDNYGAHYVYNSHGDVTKVTNASGEVTKSYDYDAFGVENDESTTDLNPFRYCGEYHDSETGNIYLRARYYDPSIGSFISEDPIRDGYNWYAYCAQNPVMFVDPTGYEFAIGQVNDEELLNSFHIFKNATEIVLENLSGYELSVLYNEDEGVYLVDYKLDYNGNKIVKTNAYSTAESRKVLKKMLDDDKRTKIFQTKAGSYIDKVSHDIYFNFEERTNILYNNNGIISRYGGELIKNQCALMYHEVIHTYHYLTNIHSSGSTTYSYKDVLGNVHNKVPIQTEEAMTVGLGEYVNVKSSPSENNYRAEMGLPKRVKY